VGHDGRTDVSFTMPKDDLPRIRPVIERVVKEIEADSFTTDDGIAKVSLVGAGIKSDPGVAARMFAALAAEGINIEMISTSSIRVSCVIRAEDAERAVRAIHRGFDLTAEAGRREEHPPGTGP
jgi:aspartate kinase